MKKAVNDDLFLIVSIMNKFISDEQEQDNPQESQQPTYIAEVLIQQEEAYFQKLLVELFEAYLTLNNVKHRKTTLDDCNLIRVVGEFSHAFYIMCSTKQLSLFELQLCQFLTKFLED